MSSYRVLQHRSSPCLLLLPNKDSGLLLQSSLLSGNSLTLTQLSGLIMMGIVGNSSSAAGLTLGRCPIGWHPIGWEFIPSLSPINQTTDGRPENYNVSWVLITAQAEVVFGRVWSVEANEIEQKARARGQGWGRAAQLSHARRQACSIAGFSCQEAVSVTTDFSR